MVRHFLTLTDADVNITDSSGLTPLHWACGYVHHKVVVYLLALFF